MVLKEPLNKKARDMLRYYRSTLWWIPALVTDHANFKYYLDILKIEEDYACQSLMTLITNYTERKTSIINPKSLTGVNSSLRDETTGLEN